MEKIKEVQKRFQENLKQIKSMVNVGSEMEEILLVLFCQFDNNFKEAIKDTGKGFTPLKHKLDGMMNIIKTIKGHPSLQKNYEIVYNQALVLIIANFESFMNDLFKNIINHHLYLIKWPEKKKIAIDTSLLEFSSSPNIGNLFVRSLEGENNFQDLGSTLRFLEKYLEIDTKFLKQDKKDLIVFYQAVRHVIIHNSSKIDDVFLRQVKNTKHNDKYKLNDLVKLLHSPMSYLTL